MGFFCYVQYEDREYRIQASYWKPEIAKDYGHIENELYLLARKTFREILYLRKERSQKFLFSVKILFTFPLKYVGT